MTHELCYGEMSRSEEKLHYTMCGLDDVYLIGGFERVETSDGPGVSIKDIDQLHEAIALHIVKQPDDIKPREVRFLRHELDMSQRELAEALGVDSQTVARWEKGETLIKKPAEILLRVLFFAKVAPEETLKALKEKLNEISSRDASPSRQPLVFCKDDGNWSEAA